MADSSQDESSSSNPSLSRDCSSDGESDGPAKPVARASWGTQCTGPSCSWWAITCRDDEPWTHHRLCGTHLVYLPTGPACEVSPKNWKAFRVKDLQLQKKRDYEAHKSLGKIRSQSTKHYNQVQELFTRTPIPVLVGPPNTGKSFIGKVMSLLLGLQKAKFNKLTKSGAATLLA